MDTRGPSTRVGGVKEFENTKTWGPLFWTIGPQADPRRFMLPIKPDWAREFGPPWRFGWGIRLLGEHFTHTIGVWWKVGYPDLVWTLELDEDGEEVSVAVQRERKPGERKSSRWTWAMLQADRDMRRPEMNLLQYVWFHWRGKKLAKRAEKVRLEKQNTYDEWAQRVIRDELNN